MTVGAKKSQIGFVIVTIISVNMLNFKRYFPGELIYFVPTTSSALIVVLIKKILNDITRNPIRTSHSILKSILPSCNILFLPRFRSTKVAAEFRLSMSLLLPTFIACSIILFLCVWIMVFCRTRSRTKFWIRGFFAALFTFHFFHSYT